MQLHIDLSVTNWDQSGGQMEWDELPCKYTYRNYRDFKAIQEEMVREKKEAGRKERIRRWSEQEDGV